MWFAANRRHGLFKRRVTTKLKLLSPPRALIPTRFTRGFSEERFDDSLDIRALALGALWLLRVVFLNGAHFAKFLVALTANVFVEGHTRTSG